MNPLQKTPDQRLADAEAAIAAMQKQLAEPPTHYHTGLDSNKISWFDIDQKNIYVHHTIYGADAATAANYGVFFIVPRACLVTKIQEVHQTAGTDVGAVTLNIEKLTGTETLDAGDAILASALSLKATADTIQTGTLTGTAANKTLAVGDRLAMDDAGTLTAVANVTVLITLQLI